jgi:hypothetical protein
MDQAAGGKDEVNSHLQELPKVLVGATEQLEKELEQRESRNHSFVAKQHQ